MILKAENLVKHFTSGGARIPILNDADLSVDKGELVLLLGPSGSGKTTLLSVLAGLLRPDGGKITLAGETLDGKSEGDLAEIRRKHVGFVFQAFHLFDALSARDNVAEVLAMRGWPIRKAREEAIRLLTEVGLAERIAHTPRQLSSGQKQRVAIARALAGSPKVIFGDEPTAALDRRTAEEVMDLFRRQIKGDRAAVIVTHDTRLEKYADRVLSLRDGSLHAVSVKNAGPHEHAEGPSEVST